MAAEDLEEELRGLQAGEERRGSCNGCCFDAVMEQLFALGATHARQQIQALQEEFVRRFGRRAGRGASAKSSQSSNGSTSARLSGWFCF